MNNYRLYGKMPAAAAVIHGGPGALGSVAAVCRELSKDFGVAEPLQTKNSINGLIEELHGVLTTHCAARPVLIGHSWGAWLICLYAARYPGAVGKLVLVGSGPFETSYVQKIAETRRLRLADGQAAEMDACFKALNDPRTENKDEWMRRLRTLPDTDGYNTMTIETEAQDMMRIDADLYGAIWPEAAAMRESGELLRQAKKIICPVTAIHGAYDPHPADGVRLPLEASIKTFKLCLLERCGHSPWKERYAAWEFYEVLRRELFNFQNN